MDDRFIAIVILIGLCDCSLAPAEISPLLSLLIPLDRLGVVDEPSDLIGNAFILL